MSAVATPVDLAGASRARRLAAWVAERHGPALLVPILLLYALAVATGALAPGARHVGAGLLVLGGVAAWAWFLLLRIVDDLGDRTGDDALHPDRLLQRGVVRDRELGGLALAAAAGCGAISVAIDGGLGLVTLLWALSLAFVGAARVDFGARRVLDARPFLGRMLRTPASVLPVLWFAAMGSGGTGLTVAMAALVVAAVLMVVSIDVSRKFSPSVAGEPSWSGRLGVARASWLLAGVLAAFALTLALLLIAASAETTAAIAALLFVGGAGATAAARGSARLAPVFTLLLVVIALAALVRAG